MTRSLCGLASAASIASKRSPEIDDGRLPFICKKYLTHESESIGGAQVSAVSLFTLPLLVAALATGHFAEWLMLWFLPTRLGILALNVFFQWLPHHPFDQTERYLNTRISLWTGGTFLLLQQNLHLMHHLWPSVPFYNYHRLFVRLRPVLALEGSRIEGLMVGPRRRTITG